MWRQSFKSSSETTGNNRHVCLRDEHPKSVFERHHRAVATASTFRKDDEDRSFFLQFPAQIGQGMRPAIFPPHRQGVEHDCRKRAGHSSLKENVPCGYRKRAFAMASTERCSKNQCVEVAAVIRNEHKGPVRRQVFPAGYREAVRDREISSQQRKTSVM